METELNTSGIISMDSILYGFFSWTLSNIVYTRKIRMYEVYTRQWLVYNYICKTMFKFKYDYI